ncbi:MAG: hypothetical protein BGP21_00970 [Thiobacillus sp. 65-29]|nr:MAG: hypothetical protein BGP21_00970 [Thiobacillus sp. 65-29]
MSACKSDGTATETLDSTVLESAFVAQSGLVCPDVDSPCSPPTSSSTMDFVKLVTDTLDGIQPRAIRFNEPGIAYEIYAEAGPAIVTRYGVPMEATVTTNSSASYARATPEIIVKPGMLTYDGEEFPYHSTPPSGEPDLETRHYCKSFPFDCVILTIPLAPDLVLPARHVIDVQRYHTVKSGDLKNFSATDRRWRGTLGALTDRLDVLAAGNEPVRYYGILTIFGGDGSPVPEYLFTHFGMAGCPVSFTLDSGTRVIDGADIHCDYTDDDGNHVSFSLAGERFTLKGSRLERGLAPTPHPYSVSVRAGNASPAPRFGYTDEVSAGTDAITGAVFGPQGHVAVLKGKSGTSVFEITAVRDPAAKVMLGLD